MLAAEARKTHARREMSTTELAISHRFPPALDCPTGRDFVIQYDILPLGDETRVFAVIDGMSASLLPEGTVEALELGGLDAFAVGTESDFRIYLDTDAREGDLDAVIDTANATGARVHSCMDDLRVILTPDGAPRDDMTTPAFIVNGMGYLPADRVALRLEDLRGGATPHAGPDVF